MLITMPVRAYDTLNYSKDKAQCLLEVGSENGLSSNLMILRFTVEIWDLKKQQAESTKVYTKVVPVNDVPTYVAKLYARHNPNSYHPWLVTRVSYEVLVPDIFDLGLAYIDSDECDPREVEDSDKLVTGMNPYNIARHGERHLSLTWIKTPGYNRDKQGPNVIANKSKNKDRR